MVVGLVRAAMLPDVWFRVICLFGSFLLWNEPTVHSKNVSLLPFGVALKTALGLRGIGDRVCCQRLRIVGLRFGTLTWRGAISILDILRPPYVDLAINGQPPLRTVRGVRGTNRPTLGRRLGNTSLRMLSCDR